MGCHPLCRFVAALRALIEDHVFPAIERGPNSVDMHGLKDVAGRAMNQRRKAIADACEWLRRCRARHVGFLIEKAGAQYSQSPAIAKGPLGDGASLIPNVRESLVNIARSRRS